MDLARFARFYSLNPFAIERDHLLALHSCMDELVAEEEIQTRAANQDITPRRLHDLILRKSGSKLEAEMAAAKLWLNLSRNEAMRSLHQGGAA